jgi:cardiolipin synthase
VADAPVGPRRAPQSRERARLTSRRLLGLDRSGPAPPETLAGRPLRPWTIPNAIGYLRLALIPVFVAVALDTRDGRTGVGAAIFAVIGWSDYLDGIAARLTRQYSRLGALLDPLVDRLLVVAGLAICWHFGLLPRWAIAVLAARELLMLALGRFAIGHGLELRINWFGRAGVWWTMSAPFWAMVDIGVLARLTLYVGLLLSLTATVIYLRQGARELQAQAQLSS